MHEAKKTIVQVLNILGIANPILIHDSRHYIHIWYGKPVYY